MTIMGKEVSAGGAASWLHTLIVLAVALAGLAAVYANFTAQNALQDERIMELKVRVAALGPDHDALTRIAAQLEEIKNALAKR